MFEDKIKDKTARVAIVGLGYVGLPLAVAFAESGLRVTGLDVQLKRVDEVNRGESYIADISNERLQAVLSKGLLKATREQDRLREVDAICICVPTPLTKTRDPDLSYVTREAEEISQRLRRGQLVILESTTYPGTTRQVVQPILERSGLKAGPDFYLAFSPERVDPGSRNFNIRNTPKIVGGIDAESTEMARLVYQQVADKVIPVSSPDTAEMTKVFENVFRSVNIALVNELAQLCQNMGVSVWEVIDAAASKPFGYMAFYPGPGVGGHCIPLDPYYLADKALEFDFHTRFIELAAEINERMPYYVMLRVMEVLNTKNKSLKDTPILVLGVAYKKDVGDARESPSLKLVELLLGKGTDLRYNDPHVPSITVAGRTMHSVELTDKALSDAECCILATDHSVYDLPHIVGRSKVFFDARGATKHMKNANIVRLGE
jgi:UDP-N-acetyl-D-glucosamine dehydrogenase